MLLQFPRLKDLRRLAGQTRFENSPAVPGWFAQEYLSTRLAYIAAPDSETSPRFLAAWNLLPSLHPRPGRPFSPDGGDANASALRSPLCEPARYKTSTGLGTVPGSGTPSGTRPEPRL